MRSTPPDNEAIRATANSSVEIKELLEKLSVSTDKLVLSVDKLSISSERLENLTKVLIVLTVFTASLFVYDIYFTYYSNNTKLFIILALLASIYAGFSRDISALLRKK